MTEAWRWGHTGARGVAAATARLTAAFRATEARQPEPLFVDPWAAALAGAEVLEALQHLPAEVQARAPTYTVIRTRVFDDWQRPPTGGAAGRWLRHERLPPDLDGRDAGVGA